jgi:hypothetical protein
MIPDPQGMPRKTESNCPTDKSNNGWHWLGSEMARGLGTHVSSERAKAPGGKGVTEGAIIWSLTLAASQAVGATEDLDTGCQFCSCQRHVGKQYDTSGYN